MSVQRPSPYGAFANPTNLDLPQQVQYLEQSDSFPHVSAKALKPIQLPMSTPLQKTSDNTPRSTVSQHCEQTNLPPNLPQLDLSFLNDQNPATTIKNSHQPLNLPPLPINKTESQASSSASESQSSSASEIQSAVSSAQSSQTHQDVIRKVQEIIAPELKNLPFFSSQICFQGRYKFSKILGKGAFGLVVLATDTCYQKTVAIKFAKKSSANRFLEFEFSDLKNLNAIDPLHTIRPLALYKIDIDSTPEPHGQPFDTRLVIVSEYGGLEVERTLVRKKSPAPRRFSDFMHLFSQAIAYWKNLKKYNLVQRDIKPENMLIDGPFEKPGSLKFIDPMDLNPIGKPSPDYYVSTRYYRSPSVLSGRLTEQEVPFALGASLYRVLTRLDFFPSEYNPSESRHVRMQRHLQVVFDTTGFPSPEFFTKIPTNIFNTFFKPGKRTPYIFKTRKVDNHLVKGSHKQKRFDRITKAKDRIFKALQNNYKTTDEERSNISKQLFQVFSLLFSEKVVTPDQLLQQPLFKKYQSIVKIHIPPSSSEEEFESKQDLA